MKWKAGMTVFFSGLYPCEHETNFKFATVLAGKIVSIQLLPVNGGKISKNMAMVKITNVARGLARLPEQSKSRVLPVSIDALRLTLDEAKQDAARNYQRYRGRMEQDAKTIVALLDENAEHLAGLNQFEIFGLQGG